MTTTLTAEELAYEILDELSELEINGDKVEGDLLTIFLAGDIQITEDISSGDVVYVAEMFRKSLSEIVTYQEIVSNGFGLGEGGELEALLRLVLELKEIILE